MGKTKLEQSVSEIIGLPTNEFTLYRIKGTKEYKLYVHYKYFDKWVGMYSVENILFDLGWFLLDKENIKSIFETEEKTHIWVYLKGEWQAIYLYKFDYNRNFFLHKEFDENKAEMSYCTWKLFR